MTVLAGAYRVWRMLGTGISFALFYLGCLTVGPTAIAWALLAIRSPQKRARFLQRAFHRLFGWFAAFMQIAQLARFRWIGFESLGPPCGRLIVANHPTLIDVVLLIARLPEMDCIVKAELFENRFTRHCVSAAGFVPNSAGQAVIDAAVDRLRKGHDVLLFPEGTRSAVGRLNAFQRGAARIALAAGCDIIPVFVRCQPPMLFKGSQWYDTPRQRPRMELRVGAPVRTRDLRGDPDQTPAATRALTELLERRYSEELGLERV